MNRRSNPRNNRSCKLSAALQTRILSDLNLAPRRSRTHKAVAVALGIESKKEKLSKQEWKKILELAKERKVWDKPCVICCEHFKLDDQVLTSCCHAYHRACLFSFEKFVGRTKTCSLCRVKDYQKLNTSAGNPSGIKQQVLNNFNQDTFYMTPLAILEDTIFGQSMQENPNGFKKHYVETLVLSNLF